MKFIHLPFFLLALVFTKESYAQACSDNTLNNETVTFSSNCTLTTLTFQNTSTLHISDGVTVTLTTLNLTYGGTHTINLGAGSVLHITGNLNDTGSATQVINGGTVTIDGDFLSGNGGTFTINNSTVSATDYSINSTFNVNNTDLSGGTFSILSGRTVNLQSTSSMSMTGLISVNGPLNLNNSTINSVNTEVLSGRAITMTNGSDWFLDGTLDLQGNLTINNSDMEIVQNLDHDTGGDATVTVTNNGTLLVRGNYDMGDGSSGGFDLDITNGGVVRVLGDLNIGNNSNAVDIDGDSALAVEGDVTGDNVGGSITSGGAESCESGGGTCCGSAALCASTASTLPIELLSFDATVKENGVLLSWTTATEINNDFFTLERSSDGKLFEPIAQVSGAGNSEIELGYHYIDYPDYFGNVYYRLVQTDFDGTSEAFRPVMIRYQSGNKSAVLLFPTSLKAGAFVNMSNCYGEVKSFNINMTAISGQSVHALEPVSKDGLIRFYIPQIVRPGIYIVSGQVNGQNISGRILVSE